MARHKNLTREEEFALGARIQKGLRIEGALVEQGFTPEEVAAWKQPGGKQASLEEVKARLQEVGMSYEDFLEARFAILDGESAVEELVTRNKALVINRVQAFKTRFPAAPEFEDLVQEGMIGLHTAAKKYDPARENKFSTMAFYWIVQAISRGANKTGHVIYLPENRVADFSKIHKAMASITQDGKNTTLTSAEVEKLVAKQTNLSLEDVRCIRAAAAPMMSLNKAYNSSDEPGRELIDVIGESYQASSSEASVISNKLMDELFAAINDLDTMQKDVILSAFGITVDDDILTERAVRKLYKMSTEEYRELLREASEAIRAQLAAKDLTFDDFAGVFTPEAQQMKHW